MKALEVVPVSTKEAQRFVALHHRHNKPPRRSKFAVGAWDGQSIVGVAIAGNPVARALCDRWTIEVLRVCVVDGAPKGCGPAYPVPQGGCSTTYEDGLTVYQYPGSSGMSLRDWFAGQALAGLTMRYEQYSGPVSISERAYEIADAMLAEREKKP